MRKRGERARGAKEADDVHITQSAWLPSPIAWSPRMTVWSDWADSLRGGGAQNP